MEKLNASSLKATLWETLNGVKSGEITPGMADSVATQSREILRTVNTQIKISSLTGQKLSKELVDFGGVDQQSSES